MRYVLGIESGRAGVTAVVADTTGRLLGSGYSCVNSWTGPGSLEEASRAMTEAIRAAQVRADLENAHFLVACVNARLHHAELAAQASGSAAVVIRRTAAQAAFYSTTLGHPGVVVLAGRSALAYGVDLEGREASAGGWSLGTGDAGSGGWIGLKALNACCRASDGIGKPTQILPLLLQHLEAPDLRHVQASLPGRQPLADEVADLAEVVYRAALSGDATARSILREAGKELALTVSAVLQRLDLSQKPVMIGTSGGVFRSGRLVLRTFREVIKRIAPLATIAPAQVPPAVAAAVMAVEEAGGQLNGDIRANILSTLPRLGSVRHA